MTALVGDLRALDANPGRVAHGVLTDRPGTLTNDFFVNLLDMGIEWHASTETEGVFEGRDRATGDVRWTGTRGARHPREPRADRLAEAGYLAVAPDLLSGTGADVAAACVFYGTAPEDPAVVASIRTPVYGFYGGNDARVNATLPATRAAMSAAGKRFDAVVYDGAGHAFLRKGGSPDARPEDRAAHAAAWERLLDILAGL